MRKFTMKWLLSLFMIMSMAFVTNAISESIVYLDKIQKSSDDLQSISSSDPTNTICIS